MSVVDLTYCTGHIISKPFAERSKSEHEAVMIVTDNKEYLLRRMGGNPFNDEELNKLVGHEITCEGRITGNTFIMTNWKLDK